MTMCSSSVSLLLFLLALSTLSALASDFELNIDCGSDTTYTDRLGRQWVGDGDYIQSGKSMKVSRPFKEPNDMLNTLRVFSTGQKGCYSVPNVPRQHVLLRARFYYGNYDGKSSPPTFDLLLENSNWTNVTTYSDKFTYAEAIYVVSGGTVDVCVSKTSTGQVPFMSALQIRSISSDMYRDLNESTAFVSHDKFFFGGVPGSAVADSSGRYWVSRAPHLPIYIINATSAAAPSVPRTDSLPQEAPSHAMTVQEVSTSLQLGVIILPDSVTVYVTMYFSEVTALTTDELRSFNVYVDGRLSTKQGAIVPPYGDVLNYTITAYSSSIVSLQATSNSTHPPILNAYEAYTFISIAQPDANSGTPTMPPAAPTLNPPAPTSGVPSAAPTLSPPAPTSGVPSAAPTFSPPSPTSGVPSAAPTFSPPAPTSGVPSAALTFSPPAPTSGVPSTAPTFSPPAPTFGMPSAAPTLVRQPQPLARRRRISYL